MLTTLRPLGRYVRKRQLLTATVAVTCLLVLVIVTTRPGHRRGAAQLQGTGGEQPIAYDYPDAGAEQRKGSKHGNAHNHDTGARLKDVKRKVEKRTTTALPARLSSTINYGNPKFSLTPDTYAPDKPTHCKPVHGRVDILVIFAAKSIANFYAVAQNSLQCYARTANYRMHYVDLDNDPLVLQRCRQSQVVFFRRHCAVAAYLGERLTATDWLLVLDADTGVVNPMKCIEDYIDTRVNLIVYERLFNWEIACGNYIIRNNEWARKFMFEYADMQYEQPKNWNGFDNGALQIKILETVHPRAKTDVAICDKIWRGNDPASTQQYEIYMRYVTCVKVYLGSQRVFPNKLKILRRGHAWVRDTHTAGDKWCDKDFMMHGWKVNDIGQGGWQSPFTRIMSLSECEPGAFAWPWRESEHLSVADVKTRLIAFEKDAQTHFPKVADNLPFIREKEIADCWPTCDEPPPQPHA